MWPSARARQEARAADDPWGFAGVAADDFLTGRTSGRQFVAVIHAIGHDGPDELQDLVELDDEYDPAIDVRAEEKFSSDQLMEFLARRAREILTGS